MNALQLCRNIGLLTGAQAKGVPGCTPGKLRIGRFDMNWAGVIAAAIFVLLRAL